MIALAVWCAITGTSRASAAEHGSEVPVHYRHAGVMAGVPYKILYAIALAESGLARTGIASFAPWPWTLNFGGRSARFDTREETFLALQAAIAQGQSNIDVGVAQINYHWNGELMPDLFEALDPSANLKIATRVLLHELGACGEAGWWCAVGRYHSPGDTIERRQRADAYRKKVRAYWEGLM